MMMAGVHVSIGFGLVLVKGWGFFLIISVNRCFILKEAENMWISRAYCCFSSVCDSLMVKVRKPEALKVTVSLNSALGWFVKMFGRCQKSVTLLVMV